MSEVEAYSVDEFCRLHQISRAFLYKLWAQGIGPRNMRVGTKRLISREAAIEWRRELEARGTAETTA